MRKTKNKYGGVDFMAEAKNLAETYKSLNPIERLDFQKEVLKVASSWDMFTRSFFLGIFEEEVGVHFCNFWEEGHSCKDVQS